MNFDNLIELFCLHVRYLNYFYRSNSSDLYFRDDDSRCMLSCRAHGNFILQIPYVNLRAANGFNSRARMIEMFFKC